MDIRIVNSKKDIINCTNKDIVQSGKNLIAMDNGNTTLIEAYNSSEEVVKTKELIKRTIFDASRDHRQESVVIIIKKKKTNKKEW